MIKTIEQARKVQERRITNGKQGYSKAVRAFCKRNLNLQNLDDYNAYLMLKNNLPSLEIKPKAKDEAGRQRKGKVTVNGAADVIAYLEDN